MVRNNVMFDPYENISNTNPKVHVEFGEESWVPTKSDNQHDGKENM